MKKRIELKRIFIVTVMMLFMGIMLSGCGDEKTSFGSYKEYFDEHHSEYIAEKNAAMAEDLVVLPLKEGTISTGMSDIKAAFSVNEKTGEVMTSYHTFERMYPASITKLMTALLTLEKGDFTDKVKLKENITFNEGNVVRSFLQKGDTVTVEALFNALLVSSDNDCAVILAEHIGGSVKNFTKMMNKRARELGATHTHFVNPNGLHDPQHYTTAYDLYLIFRETLKHDRFVAVVGQKDYVMEYKSGSGQYKEEYKVNTNAFFKNDYPIPTGIEIVGGKTGTTSVAKSCLILYTKNKEKEDMISVVLGAENKGVLYHTMSDLISAE